MSDTLAEKQEREQIELYLYTNGRRGVTPGWFNILKAARFMQGAVSIYDLERNPELARRILMWESAERKVAEIVQEQAETRRQVESMQGTEL